MKTFQDYADYYDAIYKEKDYAQECDFLEAIFERHVGCSVKTVLDLGCGTGGHSLLLAKRGYAVVGVDMSEPMLLRARGKSRALKAGIEFLQADIRQLSLGRTFDAVISMFAVISYQATAEDVAEALKSIRNHLNGDGLFVFDIWFGPAVLAQKPEERTVSIDLGEGQSVVRVARPVLDTDDQTVEVNYNLTRLSDGAIVGEIEESHLVRYFFPGEISHMLAESGFETLSISPFGSLNEPASEESWNVTIAARAI